MAVAETRYSSVAGNLHVVNYQFYPSVQRKGLNKKSGRIFLCVARYEFILPIW